MAGDTQNGFPDPIVPLVEAAMRVGDLELTRDALERLAETTQPAGTEFALGIEALDRFIHKEPLRRVHECVFGVLALESEPIDPRL